jgi:hypothetical protein
MEPVHPSQTRSRNGVPGPRLSVKSPLTLPGPTTDRSFVNQFAPSKLRVRGTCSEPSDQVMG